MYKIMKYIKRYAEKDIERALRSSGAVVVVGPKFCGKTTTSMLFQKSFMKLNTNSRIKLARLNPKQALEGKNPRLIDEWQTVPEIWNYVKEDLDNEYQFGKYILTGSSTPVDKSEIHHSGAGRIVAVKMRPMSLYESGESKGTVSLLELFEGKPLTTFDDNEFFLQCTGNTNQRGWGQSGANGADCSFTGISQDMQGNVVWDSISNLDFYLTEGSSLTGAVVDDETYAGEGGDGYCNVYVSADSTWTVTGDSTVSSLENEGTIVDSEGKTVTIQGTDGTVYVQGDSEYTITTGSYSDTADLSGATSIQDQSAYTVEKPDQL